MIRSRRVENFERKKQNKIEMANGHCLVRFSLVALYRILSLFELDKGNETRNPKAKHMEHNMNRPMQLSWMNCATTCCRLMHVADSTRSSLSVCQLTQCSCKRCYKLADCISFFFFKTEVRCNSLLLVHVSVFSSAFSIYNRFKTPCTWMWLQQKQRKHRWTTFWTVFIILNKLSARVCLIDAMNNAKKEQLYCKSIVRSYLGVYFVISWEWKREYATRVFH